MLGENKRILAAGLRITRSHLSKSPRTTVAWLKKDFPMENNSNYMTKKSDSDGCLSMFLRHFTYLEMEKVQ